MLGYVRVKILLSPPVWGAWIEMVIVAGRWCHLARRPPYGGRGLKCESMRDDNPNTWSPPVWGAWIEIRLALPRRPLPLSPPVWGAWIEIRKRINIDPKV